MALITALESPMPFEDPRCVSCYRCCVETEMILLREDIERICRLGYPVTYFAIWSGGFYRLRNSGGRCVFLRDDGRCAIYRFRPLGCRVYPLIFDEERGPIIDPLCPLAREFEARCRDVVEALRGLRYLLSRLEIEYGYRVDWRLFEEGSRALLERACREMVSV